MVLKFAYIIVILMIWCMYPLTSAQYLDETITSSQYENMTIARPGCDRKCGNVFIPFPFGMGRENCYASSWFEIDCRNNNTTTNSSGEQKPYLKYIDLEVKFIDLWNEALIIMNPIYQSGKNCERNKTGGINLKGGSPFVYSARYNTFLAVGCGNTASFWSNGEEVSGCASMCNGDDLIKVDNCRGRKCCEASLPRYLSEYNVSFEGQECAYGLIIAVRLGYWNLTIKDVKHLNEVPAVLKWEIPFDTFYSNISFFRDPDIVSCYDTYLKHSLNNSSQSSGRRCHCRYGAPPANPYIRGSCLGEKRKTRVRWAIIGVSSSLGTIILLLGLWWLNKVVRKNIEKKRKEKFFKQNGGLLLKQRLSSGEANVDKIKLFTLKDLDKATDHFNINRVLGKGGQGTVYKGMLVDGNIVAVKKFKVNGNVEEFINEFVILSQINHRNVVKLLGCCLETEIPLLVYEFIPNGNLYEYLLGQNDDLPMTWDMRLRIATEVAGALFYLHSAASQPIYHRDIKSRNILLDGKYKAKVADFGASRMVSIEATHLTTAVQGTFGYMDPEYFHTSQLTDKSDVYSFGVVLIELLTGKEPISSAKQQELRSLASYFLLCMEENRLFDIIDERIVKEAEKEHIVVVANLARRCLELKGKRRPTMKEVTSELESIQKSRKQSASQEQHDAGIDECQFWSVISPTSNLGETSDSKASTLEIMPTHPNH